MKYKQFWYPVRAGLRVRSLLLKFSSSYGSTFFWLRRPIAVFISTLLDENHQETFEGAIHERYKNNKE